MEKLAECPICKGVVHWCNCGNETSKGCHQITCDKCGQFDLDSNNECGAETLEEIREHCAKKFNERV